MSRSNGIACNERAGATIMPKALGYLIGLGLVVTAASALHVPDVVIVAGIAIWAAYGLLWVARP